MRAIPRRWLGHDARARAASRMAASRSRLACRRCTIGCAAVDGRYFEARTTSGSKNTRCITEKMACWSRKATTQSPQARYALMMRRFGQSAAGKASFNEKLNTTIVGLRMTAPTYITIQLRRPAGRDDPGVIDEAWYRGRRLVSCSSQTATAFRCPGKATGARWDRTRRRGRVRRGCCGQDRGAGQRDRSIGRCDIRASYSNGGAYEMD